jgi:WD40 repeat protein
MGVVFKARHVSSDRIVAVKMLLLGGFAGSTELERFSQEYRVLAKLNHPQIVHVYDVGLVNEQPYFTMEYLHGGSMEKHLAGHPQEVEYSARTVAKLADAIHAAHQEGIIHRDLKPSNVFLTLSGEPKVGDFGLARLASSQRELTMTGVTLGTFGYMSPEQASGRVREIGPQTDVFSLGVILFEMLTGRPPFLGITSASTLQQVLTLDPVAPSLLNPKVPRDLETICLKCLDKEPRRRYSSAELLSDRLKMFLDGKPIPDRPITNVERLGRWCKRNPSLATAAGSSLALLLALAIVSTSFLIKQRRISNALFLSLQETTRQQILSNWDYGQELCESGKIGHGLMVMAKALDSVPREERRLRESLSMSIEGWHRQCHTLSRVYGHPQSVLSVVTIPQSDIFLTGCADGVIRKWKIASGEPEKLAHQDTPARAMAISKTGLEFAASDGCFVRLRSVLNGAIIATLDGHSAEVNSIAFCSQGTHLLSGANDGTARLWNLSTSKCEVLKLQGPVHAVGFTPDGTQFFVGGGSDERGELRIYSTNMKEGDEPLFTSSHKKTVTSASIDPLGKTLLVGDADWNAVFIDMERSKQIASTDFTNGIVSSVGLSSNGEMAILGAIDSNVAMLWDVKSLRSHWQLQQDGGIALTAENFPAPQWPSFPHPGAITFVSFLDVGGDDLSILTGCKDGFVRLWRRSLGPAGKRIIHDGRVKISGQKKVTYAVAISPSNKIALTGGSNGKIKFWDVHFGAQLGSEIDCKSPVKSAEFTANGIEVLTATSDNQLRLWDVETRAEKSTIASFATKLTGQSFCRQTETACVGFVGCAEIWDIRKPKRIGQPLSHNPENSESDVMTAISKDGEQFLTLGQDGVAKIWLSSGELISSLKHDNAVRYGAFTPDSSYAITASDDQSVRIWDAKSGAHISTLVHSSEVFSVESLSDDYIITGSRTGAQLWDRVIAKRIGPECRTGDEILSIATSTDGKLAIMGDWNGRGMIWRLPQPGFRDQTNVLEWIQIEVGMKLDRSNGRQVLSGNEWLELKNASRPTP